MKKVASLRRTAVLASVRCHWRWTQFRRAQDPTISANVLDQLAGEVWAFYIHSMSIEAGIRPILSDSAFILFRYDLLFGSIRYRPFSLFDNGIYGLGDLGQEDKREVRTVVNSQMMVCT